MRIEEEWNLRQEQVNKAFDELIRHIEAFENELSVKVLRIRVVREKGKPTDLLFTLSSRGHTFSTLPSEIIGKRMRKGNCSWCGRRVDLDEGELCDCCTFFQNKVEVEAFASSHPELMNEDHRLDYYKVREALGK